MSGKKIKKRGRVRRVSEYVGIALLLFMSAGMTVVILTSGLGAPQMSIYSDDWNGLSEFRGELEGQGYDVGHISSSPVYLGEVEESEGTLLIIAGLEREYGWTELEAIGEFIASGGSVILADDFGYGNSFLDSFSFSLHDDLPGAMLEPDGYYNEDKIGYRFSTSPIVDMTYESDPGFFQVYSNNYPQYHLLLNMPSAFIESESENDPIHSDYRAPDGAPILTGAGSWMDDDGDRRRDPGERGGPFPIALMYSQDDYSWDGESSGHLLLLSDPSIFLNDMWDMMDNSDFTMDMIGNLLPDGGRVLFDESVHVTGGWQGEAARMYHWSVGYLTEGCLFPALIISISVFVLILVSVRKKPKADYSRHRDVLRQKNLYSLLRKELGMEEYQWMRSILLEKIRISYDIPPAEFHSLPRYKIEMMLDDPLLYPFIHGTVEPRTLADRDQLEWFAERIIRWERVPEIMTVAESLEGSDTPAPARAVSNRKTGRAGARGIDNRKEEGD